MSLPSMLIAIGNLGTIIPPYIWISVLVDYIYTGDNFTGNFDYTQDHHFTEDGLYLFLPIRRATYTYTLAEPFDITQRTSLGYSWEHWSGGSGVCNVNGISLNDDGTKMIKALTYGTSNFFGLRSYDLTIPFDIDSKVLTGERNLYTGGDTHINGLHVSRDGKHVYTTRLGGSMLHYINGDPWTVSGTLKNISVPSGTGTAYGYGSGIYVNLEGTKLLISSLTILTEYDLITPFNPTGMTFFSNRTFATNVRGVHYSPTGQYMLLNETEIVKKYTQ